MVCLLYSEKWSILHPSMQENNWLNVLFCQELVIMMFYFIKCQIIDWSAAACPVSSCQFGHVWVCRLVRYLEIGLAACQTKHKLKLVQTYLQGTESWKIASISPLGGVCSPAHFVILISTQFSYTMVHHNFHKWTPHHNTTFTPKLSQAKVAIHLQE